MLICIFHGSRVTMSKHASHNRGAVTGNDIEYPIYGRCPFLRPSVRASYNFHPRNGVHFVISREAGGWSIGHAEKNGSLVVLRVTRYYVSDWLPDECEVNLARTRASLSRALLAHAFLPLVHGRSRDRNWNERMARGRVLSRGLSVEPRRTFRHPRGLFVRGPTVHSQPLIPTEGFRSKGARPGNT